MKQKLINSQLTNILTIQSYRRRMCSMAENVLLIKNLPELIDVGYINETLLKTGSIVFFIDDVLGLLALPYFNISMRDMYGRPTQVVVHGENGQYERTLTNEIGKEPEFIIMYDNQSRLPIYQELLQLSERMALCTRVQDINLIQQKSPRIWCTSDDKVNSLKYALNEIDGNESVVISLDNDFLKDTNAILQPAPFVTDKIQDQKDALWCEFLTLIGITNESFKKKERNITDEVKYSQGGTIANRYSRFESRKKAIEMINKYFVPRHNAIEGIDKIENLQVEFYDGLPTTLDPDEGRYEEVVNTEEVVENEEKVTGGDQNVV